jgi:hypothetical protein
VREQGADRAELDRRLGEQPRVAQGEAHGEELEPAPAAYLPVARRRLPVASVPPTDPLPLHGSMMRACAGANPRPDGQLSVSRPPCDPTFG